MRNYFEIKTKLPSLNDVTYKNRSNKYSGNSYKRDIQDIIGYFIKEAVLKKTLRVPKAYPCILRIIWLEKTKKRDVDNIQSSQKFVLDALVECGIFIDDSRKYISQVFHFVEDAEADGVIVEIFEKEEERK